MSDKAKAKIPGTPPPAESNDGSMDDETILKVSKVSSIFFDYPTLPKPEKIISNQKSLVKYYSDGNKKRKGDSESDDEDKPKKNRLTHCT